MCVCVYIINFKMSYDIQINKYYISYIVANMRARARESILSTFHSLPCLFILSLICERVDDDERRSRAAMRQI